MRTILKIHVEGSVFFVQAEIAGASFRSGPHVSEEFALGSYMEALAAAKAEKVPKSSKKKGSGE